MVLISVVVTAPYGISRCLVPADFFAQAEGETLELIFVDASEDYSDQSRLGLKHLNLSGAGIFALIKAGLLHARGEWILLIEDHGKPLPGLLDAYRAAIAATPEADLFFGGLENLTSVSPWSFAHFLYGGLELWPVAGLNTGGPSAANLIVRTAAVRPSELEQEGGFHFLTVERLVNSNRCQYCPNATVDHIRNHTWRSSLAAHFHGARLEAAVAPKILRTRFSTKDVLWRALMAVHGFIYRPWRVKFSLRGTEQDRWALVPKLTAIGLARAAGTFWGYVTGPGLSGVKLTLNAP
jgi:hypothetical protein